MFRQLRNRLLIGSLLAIILATTTAMVSQARAPLQTANQGECQECHAELVTHWENSAHGDASTNPDFLAAWQKDGADPTCLSCHTTGFDVTTGEFSAANVTCDTCHQLAPNVPHHPEQIMLTDESAELCGSCHVDTFSDFEASQHSAEDLTCVNCHSQHDTTLKKETVQELCTTCHTEEGHFYTYTAHADAGLICTDCHLQVNETPLGEGHGQHEHTFVVHKENCNECHESAMHSPDNAMSSLDMEGHEALRGEANPSAVGSEGLERPHAQTNPASTANFTLLAALIGMAFGAVGSPWVERRLHLVDSNSK